MIAYSFLRHWKLIGLGLALAAAAFFWNRWGHWKDVAEQWAAEADVIVIALRKASENDSVTWETAPGQIVALGESNRALKLSIDVQNQRIDEMAAEAVRLKAKATELKRIADKAEAQRKAALKRLSDMSIEPGTRSDCLILLREAEEALDLVRRAGA